MKIPKELLGAPYSVLIAGSAVTPTETSNATHNCLYFIYIQGILKVEIIGTTVIPEFPSMIATILVLTVLALTMIFTKTPQNRKLKWLYPTRKSDGAVSTLNEFILSMLLWYFRMFISGLFCILIGFIGIAVLDRITVGIKEFTAIRQSADATALFVGGFLVFTGLVIHGTSLNPIFLSQAVVITGFLNLQRLLVVLISVFVSLIFGWLFYYIFAKIEPKGIDLDDINQSPRAVGIFIFCYEVYMGLVIHSSLSIPL
ncbi:MAG: hypothetical protein ACE5Z5_01465 [Candidatus Bathyarchaeia archaeon]